MSREHLFEDPIRFWGLVVVQLGVGGCDGCLSMSLWMKDSTKTKTSIAVALAFCFVSSSSKVEGEKHNYTVAVLTYRVLSKVVFGVIQQKEKEKRCS